MKPRIRKRFTNLTEVLHTLRYSNNGEQNRLKFLSIRKRQIGKDKTQNPGKDMENPEKFMVMLSDSKRTTLVTTKINENSKKFQVAKTSII